METVRRRPPYLAALALFDDMERAADVMARIKKDGGRPAGGTFKACNAGAHGKLDVVPIDLIRNTEGQCGISAQR